MQVCTSLRSCCVPCCIQHRRSIPVRTVCTSCSHPPRSTHAKSLKTCVRGTKPRLSCCGKTHIYHVGLHDAPNESQTNLMSKLSLRARCEDVPRHSNKHTRDSERVANKPHEQTESQSAVRRCPSTFQQAYTILRTSRNKPHEQTESQSAVRGCAWTAHRRDRHKVEGPWPSTAWRQCWVSFCSIPFGAREGRLLAALVTIQTP
jgi:hypothetical protein